MKKLLLNYTLIIFVLLASDYASAQNRTYIAFENEIYFGHYQDGKLTRYRNYDDDSGIVADKLSSHFTKPDTVAGLTSDGMLGSFKVSSSTKGELMEGYYSTISYEGKISPSITWVGPAKMEAFKKSKCDLDQAISKKALGIVKSLYEKKGENGYTYTSQSNCMVFRSINNELTYFQINTSIPEDRGNQSFTNKVVFDFIVIKGELLSMAHFLSRESSGILHPSKTLKIMDVFYIDGAVFVKFYYSDNMEYSTTSLRSFSDFMKVARSAY